MMSAANRSREREALNRRLARLRVLFLDGDLDETEYRTR